MNRPESTRVLPPGSSFLPAQNKFALQVRPPRTQLKGNSQFIPHGSLQLIELEQSSGNSRPIFNLPRPGYCPNGSFPRWSVESHSAG